MGLLSGLGDLQIVAVFSENNWEIQFKNLQNAQTPQLNNFTQRNRIWENIQRQGLKLLYQVIPWITIDNYENKIGTKENIQA